jgi:hypothetical protein
MSYSDVRTLPIPYRRWFLNRLTEEFKKQSDARKNITNSSDSNRRVIVEDLPMGHMATIREKKFK